MGASITNADDFLKEFWRRQSYNPTTFDGVKGMFYNDDLYRRHPDLVEQIEEYIKDVEINGFISVSTHEYTNNDGTPMRLFAITQGGIDYLKQLDEQWMKEIAEIEKQKYLENDNRRTAKRANLISIIALAVSFILGILQFLIK